MQTQLLPCDEAGLITAAGLLRGGQVVGIPTETVYGLAANALDDEAVARIFAAKGRPQDNPLIAHVSDMAMLRGLADETPAVTKLAAAFWPGPLTLVLPCTGRVSAAVCAGLGTVAVRMPLHPAANRLIELAGVPLAAPSANLSGSPSPTTAAHVLADMQGRIPLVLDGGDCGVGVESTVLSLVGRPTVLRPGFITAAQLEEVLNCPVGVADAVTQPLAEGERPQSPGMKYKHYAPKAEITILQGDSAAYRQFVNAHAAPGVFALCFAEDAPGLAVPSVVFGHEGDDASQAVALFGALRGLDAQGAKTVYARMPACEGVGLAVYNRLLRAAAFRVKQL